MSYGFQFTNASNVVTLDSEFSRLVVLQTGRYSSGAAFSPAIATQEPPLVFVRPDASSTFQYATISGTPGNWTGFSFIGGGAGSYFCAAFKSRPTATYGLRLWSGAGDLLFDNNTPCAQFTRTISSWTYLGASNTEQGLIRCNYTAVSPLDTGDYMLINNIGMDVAGLSRSSKLYCTWEYNNNRILMFAIGVTPSINFFVPVVFAKPIS
ncbi:hypothetical protein PSH77_14935 [Pseudomonas extremorientalis]|uniref:hypothetical protein n=1 Tax=Pseudomonas extremorientalis TaxID=169669 RepID=UPI0027338EEC|nr:hypothetical protein [Pseudomonas extremorientalis]WLG53995.1 hypothetical protein PSH77_14935 [Pseudomonas extremorientalis]